MIFTECSFTENIFGQAICINIDTENKCKAAERITNLFINVHDSQRIDFEMNFFT